MHCLPLGVEDHSSRQYIVICLDNLIDLYVVRLRARYEVRCPNANGGIAMVLPVHCVEQLRNSIAVRWQQSTRLQLTLVSSEIPPPVLAALPPLR